MTLTRTQIEALPDSYQIDHILVRPNIILAPMAGVTDSTFRRMILGMGGCGLVSTEMTNANSISPKASSGITCSISCPKNARSRCN